MADGRIREGDLGAWLIKCQPKVSPDVPRAVLERDPAPVTRWCVADNYRSRMMKPGDRVLLWVSGDGRLLPRGVWGAGRVTAPVRRMLDEHGAELDKLEVPLHVSLLGSGLPAEAIRAAGCTGLEVFRVPQGSNPSWVSKDQLAVISRLLGEWPSAFDRP